MSPHRSRLLPALPADLRELVNHIKPNRWYIQKYFVYGVPPLGAVSVGEAEALTTWLAQASPNRSLKHKMADAPAPAGGGGGGGGWSGGGGDDRGKQLELMLRFVVMYIRSSLRVCCVCCRPFTCFLRLPLWDGVWLCVLCVCGCVSLAEAFALQDAALR